MAEVGGVAQSLDIELPVLTFLAAKMDLGNRLDSKGAKQITIPGKLSS